MPSNADVFGLLDHGKPIDARSINVCRTMPGTKLRRHRNNVLNSRPAAQIVRKGDGRNHIRTMH